MIIFFISNKHFQSYLNGIVDTFLDRNFKKIIYLFFLTSSCITSKKLESKFIIKQSTPIKFFSDDGKKCITLKDSLFILTYQRTTNKEGFNFSVCDTMTKCVMKKLDKNVFILKRIENLYDIQFTKTLIYDTLNTNEVKLIFRLPKIDFFTKGAFDFIVTLNDKFKKSNELEFSFFKHNFTTIRNNSISVFINQNGLNWLYYGTRYFGRTSFEFSDSFSATKIPNKIVYELTNLTPCFFDQLDLNGFFLYKKENYIIFLGEKYFQAPN